MMNCKTLVTGLSTYIPGFYGYIVRKRNASSGGATRSARYCYSVWLRHLVTAKKNNLIQDIPNTVAELGPGDSLGVGLAALLSGANKYFALDIVEHSNLLYNVSILDELIYLFQKKEDIPDDSEWPDLFPKLESYHFPHGIINDHVINKSINITRIRKIKQALLNPKHGSSDIEIRYFVPWNDIDVIKKHSVDLVLSQAVMEHIENLEMVYSAIHIWLRPGGIISVEIDFSNHVMADTWNEHWKYSDFIWKTIVWAKRPYSLNRQPLSSHLALMEKNYIKIVFCSPHYDYEGIVKNELNKQFLYITDHDLKVRNSLIQGINL